MLVPIEPRAAGDFRSGERGLSNRLGFREQALPEIREVKLPPESRAHRSLARTVSSGLDTNAGTPRTVSRERRENRELSKGSAESIQKSTFPPSLASTRLNMVVQRMDSRASSGSR